MKCTIETLPAPVVFAPLKVEIFLETEEEAVAFRHVLSCWGSLGGCTIPRLAKDFAGQLFAAIGERLP